MEIPLARPDITELERKAVLEVLNTPDLSLGPKLTEFEEKMASYAGVGYAVAVNSGTSALYLIIKALKIGEGDEVITTPLSCTYSVNPFLNRVQGRKEPRMDTDTHGLLLECRPRGRSSRGVLQYAPTPETKRIKEIRGQRPRGRSDE